MNIYLILLLVGFTSATHREDFQNEANKAVAAFVSGLQAATPLHIALGVENTKDVQRLERDIKEELRKHIEEAFDKALKKIEDAIENNKEVNKAALEYLKDLRDKMKELNIQDHEVTEELEILKGKIDDTLRKILEKMGIFDKRSTDPEMPELLQGILGDVSIKELLLKVKKMILDTLNVKTIKDAFAKIIGQATKDFSQLNCHSESIVFKSNWDHSIQNEQITCGRHVTDFNENLFKLCDWITTKGQEKVLDFFDGFLDSDSEKQKRNSEDRHREIKDYLKNIEENVDDKLAKFKKWLRELLDKGVDESEEIFQKVVETIRKMIAEGKNVSKKGLGDILGLIREFEDKFGSLYDLRNIIKDFLRKKN